MPPAKPTIALYDIKPLHCTALVLNKKLAKHTFQPGVEIRLSGTKRTIIVVLNLLAPGVTPTIWPSIRNVIAEYTAFSVGETVYPRIWSR